MELGRLWLDSTQIIESLNSEIKLIGKLAAFISWRFLSCRTIGRKAVLQKLLDAAQATYWRYWGLLFNVQVGDRLKAA